MILPKQLINTKISNFAPRKPRKTCFLIKILAKRVVKIHIKQACKKNSDVGDRFIPEDK